MTKALDATLDSVLIKLGDFGKYQVIIFSLVCVAVVLHSAVHMAFVFTAMDLEYRCTIPECDTITNEDFEPHWLKHAVPYYRNKPAKCERYKSDNHTGNIDGNCTNFEDEIEKCDTFIYKTEENTILKEYGLQCDDNLWKLTLVGTINNIGQFLGLFLSGIVSDRYGRKIVLIMSMVLCGICGLLRTFATSYVFYLVFEFLDATFGSGTYACGFIMGVELVGPNKRILTGTIISCCYAIGEILAAGSAWLTKDWRYIIYSLYGPPLLLIAYFWIVPESIRWDLSKGRFEQAKKTLEKIAATNGTTLPQDAVEKLKNFHEERQSVESVAEVFRSTSLLLRLLNCFFCWITCAYLFYGLTLTSVSLAGNSYLDFIFTALVEIPAYIVCVFAVEKLGRRWSMSWSFFLTGLACLIFLFVPDDSHNGSLLVYLVGKFGATAAFTVTYVITSEIFPTSLRHTLMGVCSTFGRIGSMVAPQTPLLAQVWTPLPIIMFTTMAFIAGGLTLFLPETVNTKLPDTIQEAIHIGKEKVEKD